MRRVGEGGIRPSDVRPSYEPPLGFAALGESTVVEEELQSQCTPVSSALPSTTIATMTAASVSYVGDCWLGVWVEGLAAFYSDINQGNTTTLHPLIPLNEGRLLLLVHEKADYTNGAFVWLLTICTKVLVEKKQRCKECFERYRKIQLMK